VTPAKLAADLRDRVRALSSHAHVPFSHQPVAALFLLNDGFLVPGVRVESATFSLTLPAIVNGYTTCVSIQRAHDIIAIASNRAFRSEDHTYLQHLPEVSLTAFSNDVLLATDLLSRFTDGGPALTNRGSAALPAPRGYAGLSVSREEVSREEVSREDRFHSDPSTPRGHETFSTNRTEPNEGIMLARSVARFAHVPASNFRVGTIIEGESGTLYPGVNVEHPDWTRILCAERNAAGTARSYGESSVQQIFLTCLDDPDGTPCGACRQVLAELAPEAALWMDRHSTDVEQSTPEQLLPGFFRGNALLQT